MKIKTPPEKISIPEPTIETAVNEGKSKTIDIREFKEGVIIDDSNNEIYVQLVSSIFSAEYLADVAYGMWTGILDSRQPTTQETKPNSYIG